VSRSVVVQAVFEERYWYPDDGGQVWLAGYTPVEEGRYLGRDAPELAARGIRIAGVAGAARHHAEALEAPELGAPLTLQRDPGNEHDPNAIQVLVSGEQIGWVPREIAAELAPQIDAGTTWSAIALREQRASPRDPRTGLTMLLAPDETIELRAA
jgi:HIRAN domain-containing protein